MTNTAIAPHGLFTVMSADEVANCLEGVTEELFARLCELTIPRVNTPGLDYREIPDDFADRCLALSWDKLTPEQQATLNKLAVIEEGDFA